ncbi:cystathionine beta-lyase, partial [Salmonella enterica subsp. enterica serovar Enteritidis]
MRLRIKKATCFYFGKIFICITRRQGADGYIHASLDIQTVKIRKRNMTDK